MELSNLPKKEDIDSISIFSLDEGDPYLGILDTNSLTILKKITDNLTINRVYESIEKNKQDWNQSWKSEFNPSISVVFYSESDRKMILWFDNSLIGVLTPPIDPRNAIVIFEPEQEGIDILRKELGISSNGTVID